MGTIRTTEKSSLAFDSMSDNSAGAMLALRSKLLNGALKAVKRICAALNRNLKALIILVPTSGTDTHTLNPSLMGEA